MSIDLKSASQTPPLRTVVKIHSEYYKSGDSYRHVKCMRVLKRKSTTDGIRAEADAMGITGFMESIDIASYPDGIYLVTYTGGWGDDFCDDDIEIKLVPFRG